jgi:hypothetical protein
LDPYKRINLKHEINSKYIAEIQKIKEKQTNDNLYTINREIGYDNEMSVSVRTKFVKVK